MKAYRVVGNRKTGFAVVLRDGAIEYDLIETRKEADDICQVLNDEIGPEWQAVFAELERRQMSRRTA